MQMREMVMIIEFFLKSFTGLHYWKACTEISRLLRSEDLRAVS